MGELRQPPGARCQKPRWRWKEKGSWQIARDLFSANPRLTRAWPAAYLGSHAD